MQPGWHPVHLFSHRKRCRPLVCGTHGWLVRTARSSRSALRVRRKTTSAVTRRDGDGSSWSCWMNTQRDESAIGMHFACCWDTRGRRDDFASAVEASSLPSRSCMLLGDGQLGGGSNHWRGPDIDVIHISQAGDLDPGWGTDDGGLWNRKIARIARTNIWRGSNHCTR